MKVKDPMDVRIRHKTIIVNGSHDHGLKIFALKTGSKGYVDCYAKPLKVDKNREGAVKFRIRGNVEVI